MKFDKLKIMERNISFKGKVEKFPGKGGWVYVPVPIRHQVYLEKQRLRWGSYPITAHVGSTSWRTKLMMKKGGGFFVALNKDIRSKEKLFVGDNITISFRLE